MIDVMFDESDEMFLRSCGIASEDATPITKTDVLLVGACVLGLAALILAATE